MWEMLGLVMAFAATAFVCTWVVCLFVDEE